jgi:hypothetical protein
MIGQVLYSRVHLFKNTAMEHMNDLTFERDAMTMALDPSGNLHQTFGRCTTSKISKCPQPKFLGIFDHNIVDIVVPSRFHNQKTLQCRNVNS